MNKFKFLVLSLVCATVISEYNPLKAMELQDNNDFSLFNNTNINNKSSNINISKPEIYSPTSVIMYNIYQQNYSKNNNKNGAAPLFMDNYTL
ncbi:MAG: hypothetical protein IJ848_00550 [Alphaproteobacteria bacterium]|nr:hypothetical protein [Alphaproteobacteria bacterium]